MTRTNHKGASRARSCESKQGFQNAGHAKRVMKRAMAAGKVYGSPSIYRCRFCGLWHWSGGSGSTTRYARVVDAIDRALSKDRALSDLLAPPPPGRAAPKKGDTP